MWRSAFRPGLCILGVFVGLGFGSGLVADEPAADKELSRELEDARRRVAGEEYELKYQFRRGEAIKTKVVHLATTETTIRGTTQESKSRSVSTKVWKVTHLQADGSATFEHSVEKVEMWQKVTGRAEITYNSETDKKAPLEYEQAADSVGKPISIVTVDAAGEVLTREDKKPGATMGLGQITTPLPKGKVKIGHEWEFPTEITLVLGEGRVKKVKTRQLYTLEQVKTGVATISVRTEVLTPINDPKLEVQLVQQLTNGEIKFDLDAGRILSKQMDWDETVVGFNGTDSNLKYLARFTEESLDAAAEVAAKP